MVRVARGVGLHNGGDLGLALEAVGFEMRNRAQCVWHRVAVGRQDEFHAVLHASGMQQVQRIEVMRHIAVGRIDDGGAAVEDMVARKQHAVLRHQQTHMVGRVAGRVQRQQGVLRRAVGL